MDAANEELSKRLHEVLDLIGASEYMRKRSWEFAMLNEISGTFLSHHYPKPFNKMSSYQVGSKCEGTTTTGLISDSDLINCYEDFPVVENVSESQLQGFSYLILTEEDKKPGYVNLQLVKDKLPLTRDILDRETCNILGDNCIQIDRKGRVCAKQSMSNIFPNAFMHGPAETFPAGNGICSTDNVLAFRCRMIPTSVDSWLYRTRRYDWPSPNQLNAMGSYSCFLVGVGHPHSANKSIEWKFSFTLQERVLMSSLNETQHKCYILLKMITKDIKSKAGKSISSYHCKTSLFYTIETSDRHWWTKNNLILCVRLCLIRLYSWAKVRNCPNYFIPDDNLFDKLSPITLKYTEYILNAIIDSGVTFLYSITCDNLGKLLNFKSKLHGSETVCTLAPYLHIAIARVLYCSRNSYLERIDLSCTINKGYLNRIIEALICLTETDHVTDHTTRDVRMVLDYLSPHIQLQYQQCMFAHILSLGGDMSRLLSKTIQNVLPGTNDCDLISSKLSLASLYIQSEQRQEECKCIIASCELDLKPLTIPVCYCYIHGINTNPSIAKLRFTDMSIKDFIRYCTTGCMLFHASQIGLVHSAFHYELFRTVYTQPGPELKYDEHWLNFITVDSQIYLYFLQYLLVYKTEQTTEKAAAWRKLYVVIFSNHNLGHRETGCNLLGWICLQEKYLQCAWKFFCSSWIIRPFKNAAKWHMLILLREIIKGNNKYGMYNGN